MICLSLVDATDVAGWNDHMKATLSSKLGEHTKYLMVLDNEWWLLFENLRALFLMFEFLM